MSFSHWLLDQFNGLIPIVNNQYPDAPWNSYLHLVHSWGRSRYSIHGASGIGKQWLTTRLWICPSILFQRDIWIQGWSLQSWSKGFSGAWAPWTWGKSWHPTPSNNQTNSELYPQNYNQMTSNDDMSQMPRGESDPQMEHISYLWKSWGKPGSPWGFQVNPVMMIYQRSVASCGFCKLGSSHPPDIDIPRDSWSMGGIWKYGHICHMWAIRLHIHVL